MFYKQFSQIDEICENEGLPEFRFVSSDAPFDQFVRKALIVKKL